MQRESDGLPVSSYTAYDTAYDTLWAVRSSHLNKHFSIQTNLKKQYTDVKKAEVRPYMGFARKSEGFLSIKKPRRALPMWQFGIGPIAIDLLLYGKTENMLPKRIGRNQRHKIRRGQVKH